MGKRKINVGGTNYDAEEVEFQANFDDGGEQWSSYILSDGTHLKIKSVLASVLRLEGVFAPNGDPLYQANASLIVSTNAPEHLRKKD